MSGGGDQDKDQTRRHQGREPEKPRPEGQPGESRRRPRRRRRSKPRGDGGEGPPQRPPGSPQGFPDGQDPSKQPAVVLTRASWPLSARATVLLLTSMLVLGVIYLLRSIFMPLFVALLIAYTLNPLVGVLQKLKLRRWLAVSVLFLLLLSVVVGATMIAIPQVNGLIEAVQGDPFTDENKNGKWDELPTAEPYEDANANLKYDPGYAQLATRWTHERVQHLSSFVAQSLGQETQALPDDVMKSAGRSVGGVASFAGRVASWIVQRVSDVLASVINLATLFFLLPMYTFFLLLELPHLWENVKSNLPGRHRDRILTVAYEIHRAIALFLRGRIWIALIKGVLIAIGLSLLGVKFAFLIGMASGVASILPFIGPIVGFIPSSMILFFDKYEIMPIGLLVGVFVIVELIEGYVLYPALLGKDLDLHPLTLIVSLFAFGAVLGFAGIMLAVPAVCALKIIAREYVLPHLKALAQEGSVKPR